MVRITSGNASGGGGSSPSLALELKETEINADPPVQNNIYTVENWSGSGELILISIFQKNDEAAAKNFDLVMQVDNTHFDVVGHQSLNNEPKILRPFIDVVTSQIVFTEGNEDITSNDFIRANLPFRSSIKFTVKMTSAAGTNQKLSAMIIYARR